MKCQSKWVKKSPRLWMNKEASSKSTPCSLQEEGSLKVWVISRSWLRLRIKSSKSQRSSETPQESSWDSLRIIQMCPVTKSLSRTTKTICAQWLKLWCMKWLKINLLPISKKMSTLNLTNKESSTSSRKKIESWTLTSRESTRTTKRSKMNTLKRLKNLRMKSSDWKKVSTKPKLTLSFKDNIKREKSKASYNAWSVKTQESRMILRIRSALSKSNSRLRSLSVRRSEASSQRRRRLSSRKLKREID